MGEPLKEAKKKPSEPSWRTTWDVPQSQGGQASQVGVSHATKGWLGWENSKQIWLLKSYFWGRIVREARETPSQVE